MPPRPRPKPRKKPAPDLSVSEAGPSSLPSTASASKADDDDDEYFFKNRNRSSDTWKKLEKVTRDSPKRASPGSEDGFDDDVGASPRKKHKHRPRDGGHAVPDWNQRLRVLSEDAEARPGEDDSDNEIEVGEVVNGTQGQGSKNKRRKSRSRSITPPPEMSAMQRASLHHIVSTALQHNPRQNISTNASFSINLDEEEELDPELLEIINSVKSNPNHAKASNSNKNKKGLSREPSTDPYEEQSGSTEEITLTIKWIPHPKQSGAQGSEFPVTMNRSDDFQELFEEVADQCGVLVSSLVVTSNRQRVFPSGTPLALGLRFSANLEACDKATHDYIRANPRSSSSNPSSPVKRSTGLTTSPSKPTSRSHDPRSDSSSPTGGSKPSSGGSTMKLIFRSAKVPGKDVPLTVRTTTTCGAVVQAFVKAAGLAGVKGVSAARGSVSVDGDKVGNEVEIGDADVEDGDMVDIVGL